MRKGSEGLLIVIFGLIVIIFVLAIEFALIAGMWYGICWALGWLFTWKIAIGVFLMFQLLSAIFKPSGK